MLVRPLRSVSCPAVLEIESRFCFSRASFCARCVSTTVAPDVAVARIAEMIDEMGLNPGQMGLIINRAPDGKLDDGVRAEIEKHGLKLFGVLPHDEAVYRCDCDGNPSAKLPDSDPMKVALRGIMQSIGL